MKKFSNIKAVLAVIVAAACALPLAGCGILSHDEYVPQLGSSKVGAPALGQDGVLRVGVNTNNSPLAGKSGDKIIGIDVDVAAALADELGLHLQTVDVGSDGESAIEDGEVDVVLGIDNSSTQKDVWVSNQYLPTGVVLFELESSNKSTPSATSSELKIAAQVSSKSAWAVNNTFGSDALSSTSDLATAFDDLGAGNVDYVASDAIIGLYAANRQGVSVKIVALLDSASGYCAMAASDNAELQSAIADALATIVDNGVVDVIETKWLGQSVTLASVPKIEASKTTTTNASDSNAADDQSASAQGQGANSSSSSSSSASTSS